MWSEFFRNGGVGMYPTLLSGFLLIASGALYALRPERRFGPFLGSLGVLTIASGLLGFSLGLVMTCRYLQKVPAAEQLGIAALGFAESLNNVILALMVMVVTGLLLSIGTLRALRAGAPTGA
jgi:hypothetical protein